jgi:hypothetical protein
MGIFCDNKVNLILSDCTISKKKQDTCKSLKGLYHEIFDHQSISPRPLIHAQKYFRFTFRIRKPIQFYFLPAGYTGKERGGLYHPPPLGGAVSFVDTW